MVITACKHCGSNNLHVSIESPGGPHYARKTCGNCGAFVCFVPKPDNEGRNRNAKQSVADVCIFHGMDAHICFFCLRSAMQLGQGERLEVEHIVELQIGGKDAIENMQVLCTACHKQKDLFKRYFNWHFNGKPAAQQDSASQYVLPEPIY